MCVCIYCIVLSLFHGHPNEAEGSLVVRAPHFANLYITRACAVNCVVHASSVATVCQSREVYQWCTWYTHSCIHTYIRTHTHTHTHTHTYVHTHSYITCITYIHTYINTLHTYINYIHAYTHIHTCIHSYITYTHTYIHTYVHTYIHTLHTDTHI
jgi:hypothetical protein